MVNTTFKPRLEQYGKVTKLQVKLSKLIMVLCIVTPCTNWLIPFALKYVKGSIQLRI